MIKTVSRLHPKVVLAIAAHPDDIDFGASGTICQWVTEGCDVHYAILTDGSKGTADRSISSTELIAMRRDEQRAAGKIIGLKDIHFFDYPDGGLEVTQQLKCDIVRLIRQVKPDVVITMDPSILYDAASGFINHPDHRAAGQAVLDAVFPLARDHLSFPELDDAESLSPHKTAHVLLINMTIGNYWTDITDLIDRKIAILQAHASQVPKDREGVESLVRRIGSRPDNATDGRLLEQFVLIDIPG